MGSHLLYSRVHDGQIRTEHGRKGHGMAWLSLTLRQVCSGVCCEVLLHHSHGLAQNECVEPGDRLAAEHVEGPGRVPVGALTVLRAVSVRAQQCTAVGSE